MANLEARRVRSHPLSLLPPLRELRKPPSFSGRLEVDYPNVTILTKVVDVLRITI
jgi:hypothetical protein